MQIKDEIVPELDEKAADATDVFVAFKAYENKPLPEGKAAQDNNEKSEEAAPKKATRLVLIQQSLSPSAFLSLFQADLLEFQRHRFPLPCNASLF